MVLVGTAIISVGVADVLLDLIRNSPSETISLTLYYLAFLFLPPFWRALIFGGLGLGMIVIGILRLNRTLLLPFLQPGKPVVDTLARYRRRGRGPRVAVIGGGHGQATLLRGMKEFTHNLTAIVTVADDGGSSGRLRESMGVLPPGDIRNCLAALSNDEDLITQLFQYRFSSNGGVLEGHSFGNLLITALGEITGSFEAAVAESGKVLSVYGQVLPSTLHDVRLVADKSLPYLREEVRIKGESRIPTVSGKVRRVWLEPNTPSAYPGAVQALLKADLIVIGPGSLYTSILPNLLVPDISAAIRVSEALKIFVCNVATQKGETDGYTCEDHISAIESHVGTGIFDLVMSNTLREDAPPKGMQWVTASEELDQKIAVYRSDMVDEEKPGSHNAKKLAKALIDIFMERTGPLAI